MRRLALEDLPPRKVLEVVSIGSWTTANPGERFLEHGKQPNAVYLIVRGRVQLMRDGNHFADLVAGNLVGSALLLTGAFSDIDAVAAGSVRTLHWELDTLNRYLDANPDTRMVMQRHLVRDLAGKLATYAGRFRAA